MTSELLSSLLDDSLPAEGLYSCHGVDCFPLSTSLLSILSQTKRKCLVRGNVGKLLPQEYLVSTNVTCISDIQLLALNM